MNHCGWFWDGFIKKNVAINVPEKRDMTIEEMIRIINALITDEPIEVRLIENPKPWEPFHGNAPNFWDYEYRIKPEPRKPREFTIMENTRTGEKVLAEGRIKNGDMFSVSDIKPFDKWQTFEVREVLPE